jgi:predicted O-methyltransferase YrrM
MESINKSIRYFRFLLASNSRHGVHSPFVYKLVDEVIYNKSPFYAYDQIEVLRKNYLNDHSTISISDMGAGSKVFNSNTRKVSSIAKYSVKPAKYGQLLFRLVQRFKPNRILELGTSLGISTLYLALARPSATVITIEGCPQTAEKASAIFKKSTAENIQMIVGNFDDKLPEVLFSEENLDFVFIDGNHKKEATLRYFRECLKRCTKNSVIIFDDINWSKEMQEAWQEITHHPEVMVSIDLFFMGIIFFRTEQPKEHFKIRY